MQNLHETMPAMYLPPAFNHAHRRPKSDKKHSGLFIKNIENQHFETAA
jgi:hypothetical protein